jgi:ascorbate-specific PTS system EIIC-type component UlaA
MNLSDAAQRRAFQIVFGSEFGGVLRALVVCSVVSELQLVVSSWAEYKAKYLSTVLVWGVGMHPPLLVGITLGFYLVLLPQKLCLSLS